MKRILFFLLLSFTFSFSFGQTNIITKNQRIPLNQLESVDNLYKLKLENIDEQPFFTVAVICEVDIDFPPNIFIRKSIDETNWSDWILVENDEHTVGEGRFVSRLYFFDTQYNNIELKSDSYLDAEWHMDIYYPGRTNDIVSRNVENDYQNCDCPMPPAMTREQWAPGNVCPPDPTPTPTIVSHMIIHHSAGPNTSSDWAAVVRSFWNYHVNSHGWDDIGYNFLIDPNGVVYIGRGDEIQGAHFCGTNSKTSGICMIGDYSQEDVEPSDEILSRIVDLLAWKSCLNSLNPLASAYHPSSGLVLNRVSGHRDGCSTTCPGDNLYNKLGEIRQNIDFRTRICSSPYIPYPLQVNLQADTSFWVHWQDNSIDETGFIIERAIEYSEFEEYIVLPENTSEFNDADVIYGTNYSYRIRSFNDTDTSDYSNIATNIVDFEVDVKDIDDIEVRFYPNPFQDFINIEVDNTKVKSIGLYSTQGRFIQFLDVNSQMNLSYLSPAPYWLKIEFESGVKYMQIVKSK